MESENKDSKPKWSYTASDSLRELEAEQAMVKEGERNFTAKVVQNTVSRLNKVGKPKIHLRAARLAQYYIAGDEEGCIDEPRQCIKEAAHKLLTLETAEDFRSKLLGDLAQAEGSEDFWQLADELFESWSEKFRKDHSRILESPLLEQCSRGIGVETFFHLMKCLALVSGLGEEFESMSPSSVLAETLQGLFAGKIDLSSDSDSHEPYEAFLTSNFSIERNKHLQSEEYRSLARSTCNNARVLSSFQPNQLIRAQFVFLPLLIEATAELQRQLELLWGLSLSAHNFDERGEKAGLLSESQERDIAAFYLCKCLNREPKDVIEVLVKKFPNCPYRNEKHLRTRINRKGGGSSDSGVRDWIDKSQTDGIGWFGYPGEALSQLLSNKAYLASLGQDSS